MAAGGSVQACVANYSVTFMSGAHWTDTTLNYFTVFLHISRVLGGFMFRAKQFVVLFLGSRAESKIKRIEPVTIWQPGLYNCDAAKKSLQLPPKTKNGLFCIYVVYGLNKRGTTC